MEKSLHQWCFFSIQVDTQLREVLTTVSFRWSQSPRFLRGFFFESICSIIQPDLCVCEYPTTRTLIFIISYFCKRHLFRCLISSKFFSLSPVSFLFFIVFSVLLCYTFCFLGFMASSRVSFYSSGGPQASWAEGVRGRRSLPRRSGGAVAPENLARGVWEAAGPQQGGPGGGSTPGKTDAD